MSMAGGRIQLFARSLGDAFVPAKPRMWIEKKDAPQWFDLMPDGSKVAVVETVPEAVESPRVMFILNLVDRLRNSTPMAER